MTILNILLLTKRPRFCVTDHKVCHYNFHSRNEKPTAFLLTYLIKWGLDRTAGQKHCFEQITFSLESLLLQNCPRGKRVTSCWSCNMSFIIRQYCSFQVHPNTKYESCLILTESSLMLFSNHTETEVEEGSLAWQA